MESSERPIRVTLVHPSLAEYRIPVFRELAKRKDLDVQVVYGHSKDIPNTSPDGFRASPTPRWEGQIAGQLLMFQGAEWTYCSPKHSDVVVLRWSPRSLTLLPALLRARWNGVATVLWGHGYSKRERGWWRGLRNWLARQCSAVVFYDWQTRESYIRDGWDPDRLFVALNCIYPDKIELACQTWNERPQQLEEFRRNNHIAEGPVILFVSRLQPANRVDLLIQATAALVRNIPNLKTVIIGDGVAEKERLQALAAKLAVKKSVIFVDGTYVEMELAPWFLSADAFCYPANIGLSLIHAFWYGLPVITTDNVAVQNPEIAAFEHGVNGLSYSHNSVSALTDTLRQILTDNVLRNALSDAARRTVEETYTIPKMVDGLEAAIRHAAASASGTLQR